MPGIVTSISTKSGLCSFALRTPSTPSTASQTTSMSGSKWSTLQIPRRITSLSSTTSTRRMGAFIRNSGLFLGEWVRRAPTGKRGTPTAVMRQIGLPDHNYSPTTMRYNASMAMALLRIAVRRQSTPFPRLLCHTVEWVRQRSRFRPDRLKSARTNFQLPKTRFMNSCGR